MSFTVLEPSSVNSTATFTFANLTVTGNLTGSSINSNLGNSVTANYFIGNGALLTGISVGSTYSNSNVENYLPTYTGNVSANYFIGNGSQLTGLPASYSNANVASYLPTYTGNVSANYFIGNGSQLTGLPASYSNTNVASYLPTYTGNVSANYFIGNGSTLTNITGSNVTGYVLNATNANTVTTAAQPNITSVGALSALTVTGLITATGTGIKTSNVQDSSGTITITTRYGNVSGDVGVYGNIVVGTSGTGNVTATYFIGDGSQLTGLPASYSNTNVASYLPTYTGNFTAGNVNASGNVSGTYIIGNASYMTGLTASPAGSNQEIQFNDSGALGASTNFTFNKATGLLTVGSASGGSMSGANSISANYFIGNGSLLTGLSGSYSNTDVAAYLPTYTGNLVALTGEVTTTANITANYFIGNGSQLTGLPASYSNTNVASYLPTYTGNFTAGNIDVGTRITASAFTSNIATGTAPFTVTSTTRVTNLNVATAGVADSATTAGTVTTASQPNITSVGTLSSLIVSGTANITTGNITTGNFANSVFTKFQEKVVAGGSVSGTITPDASAGTIYNYTLTGAITLNSLTNAVAGTSVTLILTQGGSGSYGLTSTMKFAGGAKSLSTVVGAIDIISIFYDGTNYYAAINRGYA